MTTSSAYYAYYTVATGSYPGLYRSRCTLGSNSWSSTRISTGTPYIADIAPKPSGDDFDVLFLTANGAGAITYVNSMQNEVVEDGSVWMWGIGASSSNDIVGGQLYGGTLVYAYE